VRPELAPEDIVDGELCLRGGDYRTVSEEAERRPRWGQLALEK